MNNINLPKASLSSRYTDKLSQKHHRHTDALLEKFYRLWSEIGIASRYEK
jgi:hypothetical protein